MLGRNTVALLIEIYFVKYQNDLDITLVNGC